MIVRLQFKSVLKSIPLNLLILIGLIQQDAYSLLLHGHSPSQLAMLARIVVHQLLKITLIVLYSSYSLNVMSVKKVL